MHLIKFRNNLIAVVSFTTAIFFLGSCKNDVSEVHELTQTQDFPLKVMYEVHYEYSDSAKKQIDVFGPEAADYQHLDPPFIEFPKGIKVLFFDKQGIQEASIKSNYAKFHPDESLWEARGDVVAINKKNEELRSEELIWNQKTKKIYSEKFTTVTTDESILTGSEGFEADQSFEKWKLKGSSGTIEIEEEEDDYES